MGPALLVALLLHGALLLVLLWQAAFAPPADAIVKPDRMTVSLSTDVGLENTAPDPVPESRRAEAPVLSDALSPPEPVLQPVTPVVPRPAAPRSDSRPIASPIPVPRQPVRPREERPAPQRESRSAQARTPAPQRETRERTPQRTGASAIGSDFLAGAGESRSTQETRTPAARAGPRETASIAQAVSRQIKPHWQPPNGPEVEKIVTFVRFRLNRDGSIAGRPSVARQTGVNDINRAQADRHGEQAIRAVQLAAPFDLPEEYYDAWKSITANLDWRLSQ